jgi:hypothetical protein
MSTSLSFQFSNAGTLTAGPQGTAGSSTTVVPVPATYPGVASWTSSDPSIFEVHSTGPLTASFVCHKAGVVDLVIAVPTCEDAEFSYSALSQTDPVTVALETFTITTLVVTVS